jgi:DhnA family fructose-bisphosphate aldolase class Ia
MNRGGIAGADWELDDRFTAYDAEHLRRAGLEGGKVLLRLDPKDAGTIPTLEGCARAVTELADRGLMAMVEPLPYTKDKKGRAIYDDAHDGLVRAVTVAAGLGATSAHTWLKVPASADVEALLAATSLPALILGGAPGPDPAATFASWERALAVPNCRGLVVGRSLLYPADGDVAGAVDAAARLVEGSR